MILTIAELQVLIDANIKPLMDAEKLALLSTKKLEQQLNKAAANIKGAFSGSDVGIKQQAVALDNLQRKYDPLFAAQTKYKQNIAEISRLLDAGRMSQKQATAAVDKATSAFTKATTGKSSDSKAESIRRQSAELDSLQRSYDPVFVAQEKYKKKIADIKRLLDAGRVTQKTAAAAVNNAASAFTRATASSQAYGTSLRGVATSAVAGSNAIKLNNQQLMNMQFQMNDIGVMLASGQSPFVLFMQQGMQISQMFKPGSPFQSVLKAVGRGFMTFVTNPLNLAVLGFAAAAGAAKLFFDSIANGGKSTEAILEDMGTLSKEIKDNFENLGIAMEEAIAIAARGRLDMLDDSVDRAAELARKLSSAEALVRALRRSIDFSFGQADWGFAEVRDIKEEIRALFLQFDNGEMTIEQVKEALIQLKVSPSLSQGVKKVIDRFIDATRNVSMLTAELEGATIAVDTLGDSAVLTANQVNALFSVFDKLPRSPADALKELQDSVPDILTARQKAEAALADALKSPIASQREEAQAVFDLWVKNTEIIASRRGGSRKPTEVNDLAQRAQYLSDLQREIGILSMRSDLQDGANRQWEREKELRAAIADLGPNATASEINLVKELIPLRQQLTDALEKQLALQQEQEKLYGDLGGLAGNALQDIISGAKSAEEALLRMVVQMAAAILKAQVLASVQGQGANGQFFNALIGGILSGVRANGGPVTGGSSYLVGERGPEIFSPSSGGMIIPNHKIGASGGSNDNSVVNISVDARGAQQGVGAEIASALKDYDRNRLPGRVKQIGRNKHAVG